LPKTIVRVALTPDTAVVAIIDQLGYRITEQLARPELPIQDMVVRVEGGVIHDDVAIAKVI
jgi:hypothetical protein